MSALPDLATKPMWPGECVSTRGQWGQRCPDCKTKLPEPPGPLVSWKAARTVDIRVRESSQRALEMPDRQPFIRRSGRHNGSWSRGSN